MHELYDYKLLIVRFIQILCTTYNSTLCTSNALLFFHWCQPSWNISLNYILWPGKHFTELYGFSLYSSRSSTIAIFLCCIDKDAELSLFITSFFTFYTHDHADPDKRWAVNTAMKRKKCYWIHAVTYLNVLKTEFCILFRILPPFWKFKLRVLWAVCIILMNSITVLMLSLDKELKSISCRLIQVPKDKLYCWNTRKKITLGNSKNGWMAGICTITWHKVVRQMSYLLLCPWVCFLDSKVSRSIVVWYL